MESSVTVALHPDSEFMALLICNTVKLRYFNSNWCAFSFARMVVSNELALPQKCK
jgi:hypothetical protein